MGSASSRPAKAPQDTMSSKLPASPQQPPPALPPKPGDGSSDILQLRAAALRSSTARSQDPRPPAPAGIFGAAPPASAAGVSSQQAPALLERISKPKPSLADRIGKPNLSPVAPDDKEEGEISDDEYEPAGGEGSMLARRIGGTRVTPVQAAFNGIRSKAMHHTERSPVSAPSSRSGRPTSTRFEPATASRDDIFPRHRVPSLPVPEPSPPPQTPPPPTNIELPSPRIPTPPLPSTSVHLVPSTPPRSPSLPPQEQVVGAATPPLPLQKEHYHEATTPPLPPQEQIFEAKTPPLGPSFAPSSLPNSPPGTPPLSSTFEFSDSKETWTRPPTPEFEGAAEEEQEDRTWDNEDAIMNEEDRLELESPLAAPASNAPEEENNDYMDIIRNLLYEGVDPEALIARGAPPEHVMAVCREIVQGTRERDGFGEQETPDVGYSREGSMAYAIEPSEATAPSSENMVDDEMLAESPGSEATVEPLAYRVDPAQLLTLASVESPEPEAPRPPEPSFPTPVLSPPSHPIVSPVSQVPLESRPSPRLGSLLAPSLSVPDMPPTSASTSSGDQPAQSTLHTGLASLPPRPTSLLPPSGSTPQPSVPPEEARANAAANASTEAGPGPSTMASQAISQANQTGPSQPPQPSQPHPHPPPPTKPLKMTKKEKKAARAQAAAAAAAAASTSASVSGPTGLPPRPAVYPEPYHAAPYIQDPYAMYPVQPQPQVQAHLQHQYQPQHQRQRQPDLPQVFQQPAIFDINVEVPVTPLAQDQPPPPQTAAPPLPPGSPPADLQTMLSESKRKVLESMRRRKEASVQPSASVTPALEAPALTSTRGSTTPAIQSAEVQSTGVSIRTGDLDRSVQEEAAALEREFLGMHMTAASMASHVDPNSVTQSRSMSMEMDVDVDMDIDEPEEGEILVVSPRVSAPAPILTPAPASALPSILSTSATLPERPASAGSNLPVRRGIKRAHAEDLNESRTVSALAARPPLAARRLFCAPLRPHQLKISLDEDSDPDDTDDEDDEENRRIEADEKQRKLEEEIARLKAQIAMKKRRKLQSGQASGATTPIPTDMGSNADTEVQEISVSQDQGNLDIVKSAVIQSIGNPRGEDAFRSSTPADIKQLTQELAQKEAQKEAHDEVMQVHAPGAGVTASQDSGLRFQDGTDKSENEDLALVVDGSNDHTSFHAYKPILSYYPQLSRTLIPLSSSSSMAASSSSLDPFLNIDHGLLDSIMLTNRSQRDPSVTLCSAEVGGGKCADRNCLALHLNKTLIPSGKCTVSSSHLSSEPNEDLVEYVFESITAPQERIGSADKAKEKIRIAVKLAKNSLAAVSGGVERRQDHSAQPDSNEQYKKLLEKVGQILQG
ncbi:hypothetical protein CNBK1670 [Cryptococcus deneoformans B-3501A]|uniref:hypothetical protein n=1 Tax=Cryptococcus deneoformans (strain B-3501A) TaxID=283643 RepID=UPI000042EFC8|nr:hypothetical protein CNBK1670 [Cryptococcus neoformans var. neoformans B-3501A]EAL18146.1 hypothetical protein CNBK1670 [Cryptococcus neoformans var. neoformans B-3501A]